jgi:branched-chain amino acid transport system ATP-binding protein
VTLNLGLELEEVTVRFGSVVALDGVSLCTERGEICGLIGPNGAGKTTLFDVISGVRRPDQGCVRLDGRDISSLRSSSRARLGLQRTFQRVQVFGWLTVEDNVLAATEWRGGGGGALADLVGFRPRRRRERERRVLAQAAIERCGLADVQGELAGSLPIGLARMVEFARATVETPRLLLLDEPASGLDEAEASRLGQLIQMVRDESGCSVIVVEHNAGFIMEHCNRVVVLAVGAVLAQGSPAQVRQDPAVRSAYLGGGPESMSTEGSKSTPDADATMSTQRTQIATEGTNGTHRGVAMPSDPGDSLPPYEP